MASEDQIELSLELELIGKISVKDLAEKVAKQLSTTLQAVQEASEFKNSSSGGPHDPAVVEAVQRVQEAVHVSFIFARAFISKAHSLAKYICSEEPYTIKAIDDGNAEEFKDYLEEVLGKSQACQKDLQALIAFIEYNGKKEIDEQTEIVQERKAVASRDATTAGIKTVVGAGAAVGGGALAVTGAGVVAAGTITIEIGVLGLSSQMIAAGVAVMTPAGPVLLAVGLTVAIGGLIFAIHSAVTYARKKEMVAYCEKALKAIEEMKSNLQKIEESLKSVNAALQVEIDHNYEDISDSKLKKLSENRGVAKRALKQKVEEVAEGANRLKEYCEPLKESKNLKEFIQRIASTS